MSKKVKVSFLYTAYALCFKAVWHLTPAGTVHTWSLSQSPGRHTPHLCVEYFILQLPSLPICRSSFAAEWTGELGFWKKSRALLVRIEAAVQWLLIRLSITALNSPTTAFLPLYQLRLSHEGWALHGVSVKFLKQEMVVKHLMAEIMYQKTWKKNGEMLLQIWC